MYFYVLFHFRTRGTLINNADPPFWGVKAPIFFFFVRLWKKYNRYKKKYYATIIDLTKLHLQHLLYLLYFFQSLKKQQMGALTPKKEGSALFLRVSSVLK